MADKDKKTGWVKKSRIDWFSKKKRDALVYYDNGVEKTVRWADIPCREMKKSKYPKPPGCKGEGKGKGGAKGGGKGKGATKAETVKDAKQLQAEAKQVVTAAQSGSPKEVKAQVADVIKKAEEVKKDVMGTKPVSKMLKEELVIEAERLGIATAGKNARKLKKAIQKKLKSKK